MKKDLNIKIIPFIDSTRADRDFASYDIDENTVEVITQNNITKIKFKGEAEHELIGGDEETNDFEAIITITTNELDEAIQKFIYNNDDILYIDEDKLEMTIILSSGGYAKYNKNLKEFIEMCIDDDEYTSYISSAYESIDRCSNNSLVKKVIKDYCESQNNSITDEDLIAFKDIEFLRENNIIGDDYRYFTEEFVEFDNKTGDRLLTYLIELVEYEVEDIGDEHLTGNELLCGLIGLKFEYDK